MPPSCVSSAAATIHRSSSCLGCDKQGNQRGSPNCAPAVIYRYVLHLDSAEGRRTLRWTFAHPVLEHEEIELPTFGRWYVSRAVTGEGPASGILYCTVAL